MSEAQKDKSATTPWIVTASFSLDGKYLITGSLEGYLTEWDTATGEKVRVLLDPTALEDHNPKVTRIEDGKEVEGSFQLVRLSENMRGSSIVCVRFSPDGKLFAVGAANGAVVIWGAEYRGEWYAWNAHAKGVVAIDISHDHQWLATGAWEEGGTTLRVWRLIEPGKDFHAKEVFSDYRHAVGVWAVAFSPDGSLLASGGWGFSSYSAPRLYKVETGEEVGSTFLDTTRSLHFSPDGKFLATGGEFGAVSILDVTNSQRVFGMENAHTEIVGVVLFSPDGQKLISASRDGTLKIWNALNYKQLAEYSFAGAILACRFCGDNLYIAEAAKGADRPNIHCLPS